MLSPVLTVLRGLVFPPVCEGCGAMMPVSSAHPVCAACAASLRPLPEPACPQCAKPWTGKGKCLLCRQEKSACDLVCAAYVYEGRLKKLLQTYKFSRRRSIGPFLSGRLADFAKTRFAGQAFDAVLAVPADAAKIAERGFHAPRDWAKPLSKALNAPDRSSWLAARRGRAQIALSREQRRRNVRGRFYFRGDRSQAAGRSILLIDDVLTTGSTVAECAWVLQGAGAGSITVLCLARGESS